MLPSLNNVDELITHFCFVPGWKEGEEGSRGERQRSEGSRPDKWPPPGEWHGKHDVV